MKKRIVLNGPYANRDFFNFTTTSQLPRHRWYNFKEGFSVGLIKEALQSYGNKKNLRVLDPFNGCGTTALTVALEKKLAVGIEVNPFLEFATKVKTAPNKWNNSEYFRHLREVIERSKPGAYSNLERVSTFTSKHGLDKWLFNTGVIRRYAAARSEIDKIQSVVIRNALQFSALVSIMECCNARKDGKGLRYKKNWQAMRYSSRDFERIFFERGSEMAIDVRDCIIEQKYKPKIVLGDSRHVLGDHKFEEENFDLIITSPPYLNSFDYSDIYRPELFLGGYVNTNEELSSLRLKTLRSHVQVDWDRTIGYQTDYVAGFVSRVTKNSESLWNSRIPLMISAYFDDMGAILRNLRPRIRKGGQIWLVVSTSAYAGVHLPVDLIIGEIGTDLGYKLKAVHCLRNLRTASQQYEQLKVKTVPLRESLIILER